MQSTGPHGIEIHDASIEPGRGGLQISLQQAMQFSPEAIEALENGVPLVFTVSMELRAGETLALLASQDREYEVRYLPLSQHYQLSLPSADKPRTYPRLRHVTQAMSRLDFQLDTLPLPPGEYVLRGRTQLDPSSLPAPMQLPAALSPQWHHDSDWHQWTFEINV